MPSILGIIKSPNTRLGTNFFERSQRFPTIGGCDYRITIFNTVVMKVRKSALSSTTKTVSLPFNSASDSCSNRSSGFPIFFSRLDQILLRDWSASASWTCQGMNAFFRWVVQPWRLFLCQLYFAWRWFRHIVLSTPLLKKAQMPVPNWPSGLTAWFDENGEDHFACSSSEIPGPVSKTVSESIHDVPFIDGNHELHAALRWRKLKDIGKQVGDYLFDLVFDQTRLFRC